MAKYATQENLIECQNCHVKCTERELVTTTTMNVDVNCCPNCGVSTHMRSYQVFNLEGYSVFDIETQRLANS